MPLPKSFSIRPSVPEDLDPIVRIHQAAFPGFFMTGLGPRLLRAYYALLQGHSGAVLLVAEVEGGPSGFVSGFLDPQAFYRAMKDRRLEFVGAILPFLLLHPWKIFRVLGSYRQVDDTSARPAEGLAELSSIGVLPAQSGHGLGRALVTAFLGQVEGRVEAVLLTTDTQGNDRVNAFYTDLGFTLERSFEKSKGRTMNEYRFVFHKEPSREA